MRYAINPLGPLPFPTSNPKFVQFYDYVGNELNSKISTISTELNWKHPENRTVRFDCLLHCFGNHHSLRAAQISSNGLIFCSYIRDGLMTRDGALADEDLVINSVENECDRVIHGLILPVQSGDNFPPKVT